MALILNEPRVERMSEAELETWREIPPAIISDELNRAGTMAGAIEPVAPGMSCVGQALTVQTMVGDNVASHYALAAAWPGAVLVVDARGYTDTAVWGGIMNFAAEKRGIVGVVIDGSVRDVAELRQSKIAVYARGAVPCGPHKGWGGTVNGPIQCGGITVNPGDLVIGDDDGVVVIGPEQMEGLLERCKARIAKEEASIAKIGEGALTVDVLGLPPAEEIG